jgi:hypothetical protein
MYFNIKFPINDICWVLSCKATATCYYIVFYSEGMEIFPACYTCANRWFESDRFDTNFSVKIITNAQAKTLCLI